jgi:LAO/AO transport system kinase
VIGAGPTTTPPLRNGVPPVDELADGVIGGKPAVLGRAITLVESQRPEHQQLAQELLGRLLSRTGGAHRVGISGVPGVGKSTFIDALGRVLIERGHRVAVLAIDPSSARSGGSILGDKTRMSQLARDDRAFIRPSPTGGSLGGVARTTRETMLLCEAAGFDVVLVETVGVGQSETLVADMVDFFLVLMLAGAGDELQGIKRGIVEIADMLAINKADGDNLHAARRAQREYENALHFMRPASPTWTPPVVTCSAVEGAGLDELWDRVLEHHRLLKGSGELMERRRQQRLKWMWAMVSEQLMDALRRHPDVTARIDQLERSVLDGATTPTAAARALLEAFGAV